jgi:hypothetical protein
MSDIFTAYSTAENSDLEQGKPYLVYKVRVDGGITYFLVATKAGEFKWFTSLNFRDN